MFFPCSLSLWLCHSFLQLKWGIWHIGVAFLFVYVFVRSPIGKIWTATLVHKQNAVQHRKLMTRSIIRTSAQPSMFAWSENKRTEKKQSSDDDKINEGIDKMCKTPPGSVCFFLSLFCGCTLCSCWKIVLLKKFYFHSLIPPLPFFPLFKPNLKIS